MNYFEAKRLIPIPAAILILCAFISIAGCNGISGEFEPDALYLTWQHDPSTSITIDWHTRQLDNNRPRVLQFRKQGEDTWQERPAHFREFPFSDRKINRTEIRGLEPSTTYEFRFGHGSKVYHFNTLPATLSNGETVRFVTGGDTSDERHQMSAEAMKHNPDFILWGGDLAYANGDPERIEMWYGWFDGIMESFISDEGRVVPVVVAIGNHELFGERRLHRQDLTDEEINAYLARYNVWDDKPTFFFDLFAFPGRPSYNLLDFGDYMTIFALDSDHYSAVEGGQTGWLREVLRERQHRPHLFPVYHVPAYPSHRSYEGTTSRRIRDNWVPLFEEFGVTASFENHDHTYKRTHPIRGGQISEDGIVYIGDGCWGRSCRDGDSKDEWYIKEFASVRHGIVVTISENEQHFLAVSEDGEVIDEHRIILN